MQRQFRKAKAEHVFIFSYYMLAWDVSSLPWTQASDTSGSPELGLRQLKGNGAAGGAAAEMLIGSWVGSIHCATSCLSVTEDNLWSRWGPDSYPLLLDA